MLKVHRQPIDKSWALPNLLMSSHRLYSIMVHVPTMLFDQAIITLDVYGKNHFYPISDAMI